MQYHKSVGIIIFRYEKKKRMYLLLSYPPFGRSKKLKEYWNFPKGAVEEGETETQTALREVEEETGIKDIQIVLGFRQKEGYMFRKPASTQGGDNDFVYKTVYWLLAETKEKKVALDFENLDHRWLPFKEALEKLTFKNSKRPLEEAEKFLDKGEIQQRLV